MQAFQRITRQVSSFTHFPSEYKLRNHYDQISVLAEVMLRLAEQPVIYTVSANLSYNSF